MPKPTKLPFLSARVLGEQKPPLARDEPRSLITWQQRSNPRQKHLSAREGVSGCQDPLVSRLPLPLEWREPFPPHPLTHFVGKTAQIAQIVWILMGTTFPKSSSARVIFLKIKKKLKKMRCMRKEVEQSKANNLPIQMLSPPPGKPQEAQRRACGYYCTSP